MLTSEQKEINFLYNRHQYLDG